MSDYSLTDEKLNTKAKYYQTSVIAIFSSCNGFCNETANDPNPCYSRVTPEKNLKCNGLKNIQCFF